MIVLVEEIRAEGLALERELTPEFLAGILESEAATSGLEPRGPARLQARFEKVSDKILLEASTRVALAGACRRCLARVQLDLPVEFRLTLTRRAAAPRGSDEEEPESVRKDLEGSAASFDLQSVEEEIFDGREIDLGGLVREQVLLALPMSLLCREACKGLCTVCGMDLNETECGCERKPPDPRWAALKDIKLS
jgi:uncharacterized protein